MKNIRIALIACLFGLLAVACHKDEVDKIRTYSSNCFKVQIAPFVDENNSKAYLNYTEALSRIIYENGDKILVNGHEYTLSYEDGEWLARGDEYTGEKFYAAYCDGTLGGWDSAAGPKYNFNINDYSDNKTHNKIILAGTSDDNYVLTLKPACAILRLNTGTSGASWTKVRVGFDGDKIPATGTIYPGTRVISATTRLAGVSQGSGGAINGDFLYMRYSRQSSAEGNHALSEPGYWYVAIPIAEDEVTTTLYVGWNNGSSDIQYKTQGRVTLRKGYVYTIGTERQSPFSATGVSKCSFNVNAGGSQIQFSAGNLQAKRTRDGAWTYHFQFAPHQYEAIGSTNGTAIGGNNMWFDLFGYGTSGYSAGQTARLPNSTSTSVSDYIDANISNTYSDWGKYVNYYYPSYKIFYGNTDAHSENWRTLSSEEWTYLINRTGKTGLATVSGIQGLLLLPDSDEEGNDWVNNEYLPEGVSFTSTFSNYTTNNYSASDWDKLEAVGAIFLPVTGYRSGTGVDGSSNGYYWSASAPSSDRGHPVPALVVTGSSAAMVNTNRSWGCAVRLVVDVLELK